VGFDPASVREGVGLSGMRERVSVLGGRLDIVSRPDQRTSVKVEMPFTGSP
jgi:signal transduction histidine kinase